jgi:hypothetical protein
LAALAAASAFGAWRAGLAVAVGLLLGAFNALLVDRSLDSALGFRAASLGRLGLLSALGLGAGLLIGPQVAVLTLLALAGAHLVLTVVAGWGLLRA